MFNYTLKIDGDTVKITTYATIKDAVIKIIYDPLNGKVINATAGVFEFVPANRVMF
jgi:hypothetical protein